MKENFIPVEAYVDDLMKTWYMDISELSLTDLIDLKQELTGNAINSVKALDNIIYNQSGYEYYEFKSVKRETIKNNQPVRKSKNFKKRVRKNRR